MAEDEDGLSAGEKARRDAPHSAIPPTIDNPVVGSPAEPVSTAADPNAEASRVDEPDMADVAAPVSATGGMTRPGVGYADERLSQPAERSKGLSALFGIVTLLLLAAVAYLFYVQSKGADREATIADLKQRVVALEGRPAVAPADLADLGKRVDGADAEVGALSKTVAGLQKSIGEVEAKAQGSAAGAVAVAPDADLKPQVAALGGKIVDLEGALAALKTAVADLPKPDFGPVDEKVGALNERLADLQKRVEDIPRIDIAPVVGRLDMLETRLKPVEAELQAAASPERVAQTRAAPLAVTAQAIGRAIDAGRPFPDDIEVLRRLGTDGKLIEPLQAVSANGAPTLADLRADLVGVRDRMIAGGAPAPHGSYLERLVSGATSLVRVRPLGSVAGDTPGAIVARMDADLAGDDLPAALDEWQKLPDGARSVSKGLVDRIQLRLAAEKAARAIAAGAIGSMAGSKG